MKTYLRAKTFLLIATCCSGLAACAANRDAEESPAPAAAENPPSEEKSRFTHFLKMPKMPKMPKLADLDLPDFVPGRGVKVVDVREKDLRELPTGQERALAYKKERRRSFWIFGGPVDFKEPNLPEPGTEMDGSLLPPRGEPQAVPN